MRWQNTHGAFSAGIPRLCRYSGRLWSMSIGDAGKRYGEPPLMLRLLSARQKHTGEYRVVLKYFPVQFPAGHYGF